MKKILVLTGGGIRGIVSSQIINAIELRTGKPISESFDLIGGTSTGSIVGTSVASGYSGGEMVKLFSENGNNIFRRRRQIFAQTFGPKYDINNLKNALAKYLSGNFTDLHKKVMVFSADKKNPKPIVFKSWKHSENIIKVVSSSCAAPTFFNAVLGLIDGGVYANDPSVEVLTEARRLWGHNEDYKVFTIGTGKKNYTGKGIGTGWIYWLRNIVPYLMTIQEKRTEYVMKYQGVPYYKASPVLIDGSSDMDNASINNMQNLIKDTTRYLDDKLEEIINFIEE